MRVGFACVTGEMPAPVSIFTRPVGVTQGHRHRGVPSAISGADSCLLRVVTGGDQVAAQDALVGTWVPPGRIPHFQGQLVLLAGVDFTPVPGGLGACSQRRREPTEVKDWPSRWGKSRPRKQGEGLSPSLAASFQGLFLSPTGSFPA